MIKDGRKRLRSLIIEYFTKDTYIDLLKINMMHDIDNNEKNAYIKSVLRNAGIQFNSLGSGTNRMAVQIDGHVVKIALDRDGMTDNKREILYTKDCYPDVIKMYECTPNGLITVSEYVELFNISDLAKYKDEMKVILKRLSRNYFIGDVGTVTKNYTNWGKRLDGSICILDFAYIYKVKYTHFTCTNCDSESLVIYDDNYNDLICPTCGHKYLFGEMRRRISRKDQEDEIGDIRRLGYNLTHSEEMVEINPEFEPVVEKVKKKKKRDKKIEYVQKLEKYYKKHK